MADLVGPLRDRAPDPAASQVSRRPRASPSRLAAETEALVCELRRAHPRWGARRIAFEVAQRGVAAAPSRATVHRVLVRNAMVTRQAQQHKRKYRRWQRETPMALWQLDLVGGIYLADGRECKVLSGIDDHSRFTKPRPAEVLFERVCREHGITAKLTRPYSPTTTGKVERWQCATRRAVVSPA